MNVTSEESLPTMDVIKRMENAHVSEMLLTEIVINVLMSIMDCQKVIQMAANPVNVTLEERLTMNVMS